MTYLEIIKLAIAVGNPHINCENESERQFILKEMEEDHGITQINTKKLNNQLYIFGFYCKEPFDFTLVINL